MSLSKIIIDFLEGWPKLSRDQQKAEFESLIEVRKSWYQTHTVKVLLYRFIIMTFLQIHKSIAIARIFNKLTSNFEMVDFGHQM